MAQCQGQVSVCLGSSDKGWVLSTSQRTSTRGAEKDQVINTGVRP